MALKERTSRIPGFYKMSAEERLKLVKEFAGLTDEELELLRVPERGLPFERAERMIENVIGLMAYPFAVATNFLINGRDYLVPMVIEEPSVVAAASNGARMCRSKGGISATCMDSIMIGQIQVVGVRDPYHARMEVMAHKDEIAEKANEKDPILVKLGGGVKDVGAKVINTPRGQMLIVELYVDCKDAMGANAVNTMAEAVAPLVERVTGGRVLLRIISNLAVKRLARAWVTVDKEAVGGEEVVDAIVDAWAFAAGDPFRAATHNKGIMNGVIAVALATAQDHRALEAGAHAYAALGGHYKPLSTWEKNEDGDLVGALEMPMAVGVVGGATRAHPVARVALKILGVKTARELAEVMVAVGLAQNLAALRALATEGIQRGHMRLHARNIAMSVGATGELVDLVVQRMVEEGVIRMDRAKEILEELLRERGEGA
ncbi:MAG TPA: hydroxymethylglutaryl-CoA reductase, degradative [Candidatus Bathyarchaeota archaeon]|nr:hydroxymethylglutaryl-CoA reductase, degradative [Candidatus Bathyarchaeota archaeon]